MRAMREISVEHSQQILKEMCNRVGVDYDTFDFGEHQWFLKHTWTPEQEESFRQWLAKKLVQWKYARNVKYRGVNQSFYEAGKIIFNYGWKSSDANPIGSEAVSKG